MIQVSPSFSSSLMLREPPLNLFRRPKPPKLRNTDKQVDCTPYPHIQYRPFCQTIRLEKRRKAWLKERPKKLPTIMENLCMFEWLHRTNMHKTLTNEELLFVLTNGLFHQDKGNVAIVINKDMTTGKSAKSQMDAAFGIALNPKEAVKELMKGFKSPKVKFEIPDNLKKFGIGNVEPSKSDVEVITLN